MQHNVPHPNIFSPAERSQPYLSSNVCQDTLSPMNSTHKLEMSLPPIPGTTVPPAMLGSTTQLPLPNTQGLPQHPGPTISAHPPMGYPHMAPSGLLPPPFQNHAILNSAAYSTPVYPAAHSQRGPTPQCPYVPMAQMQYPQPQMMPTFQTTNLTDTSAIGNWPSDIPANFQFSYDTCSNYNTERRQIDEYSTISMSSAASCHSWGKPAPSAYSEGYYSKHDSELSYDPNHCDSYAPSVGCFKNVDRVRKCEDDGYRSRSPSTISLSSCHFKPLDSHSNSPDSVKIQRDRRSCDRYDRKRYDDKYGIRERSPCGGSRPSKRLSRSPTRHRSRSRDRRRSRSRSGSKNRIKSRSRNRSDSGSDTPEPGRKNWIPTRTPTERESLVERWRMNNCSSMQEMTEKLEELSEMKPEQIIEHERKIWTRSAPGDLFYKRDPGSPGLMRATPKLLALCERFDKELVQRAKEAEATHPPYNPPPRQTKYRVCKHKTELCSSSGTSSDESSSDEEDRAMEELNRKKQHPQRIHPELWHNDFGEMNDGPLCRCSHKARKSGIRHNVYAGEQHLNRCDVNTNNAEKLHHYRITVSPPVNFLTKTPTIIHHDSHEYIFEGFSMFSHFPLKELPTCKVIRFNIEYTILYIDEAPSENFTVRELDLFYDYLFNEILELVDLDLRAFGDKSGCNQFHFMPRFVRDLPENGKEILSMNVVLSYLLESSKPLISKEMLPEIRRMTQYEWQMFADDVKCMVVTYPGKKPCSLRVDQLDREQNNLNPNAYPEIVHFGIRPPQLSYAGNPEYQKVWRDYVKFRHLLANMPKPSQEDKRKLANKETRLQDMRTLSKMKRDVTIALSSEGFHRTGIMCDIIQHAMLVPVLVCHLRFHRSLDELEKEMNYKFNNRYLLQLALTHPSYRENFGTNPDHARNSLTNCGIRQPEYGDRRIHYMNTRKRGINTLIQIMSRFGKRTATESNIGHNERLEFLGDAVVEFITSIHLFHLFPDLEEGGLATYRAAIVQNQHLAVLAQKLHLDAYMLYAHGSDLCHDLELRHAMANCFEALMGALFLDGGIEVADKVFGETLFKQDPDLVSIWANYPLHPLQEQEPDTDRQWIPQFAALQKLTEFEQRIGIEFRHIRLLARAFTDRSVGYTNLTLGSNQRLEFLGDTVLQIIASEYLYKFFPEHHEGHLSLLRSSLVNNRTQAVVCDDLGMTQYAIYSNPKGDIKTKDRADLLEAFLGALYVDQGLKHCHVFCEVCFFPRLQDFIMNQDWNDPKSKLQQCCLTLRTMEGGEPDIPVYKVIECMGPTNTRVYTVAVYFRGERLAQASGHSIQQAEMNAAKEAISMSKELFPQLDHQKRVIAKSMKKQKKWRGDGSRDASPNEANSSGRRNAARLHSRATGEDKFRGGDDGCEKDKERGRDREKARGGDRSRDRERGRIGERSRDRDNSRIRERSVRRERSANRFLERSMRRERSTDRRKSTKRERSIDRERSMKRERSTDRERSMKRERSTDRERSMKRERSTDRERSVKRERSTDRERSVKRERSRDREDSRMRETGRYREDSRMRETGRYREDSRMRESGRRWEDSRMRETGRHREDSRMRERGRYREDNRMREPSRHRESSTKREPSRDRENSRKRSRDRENSRMREPSRDREKSRVGDSSRYEEKSIMRGPSRDSENSIRMELSKESETSIKRDGSSEKEIDRMREGSSDSHKRISREGSSYMEKCNVEDMDREKFTESQTCTNSGLADERRDEGMSSKGWEGSGDRNGKKSEYTDCGGESGMSEERTEEDNSPVKGDGEELCGMSKCENAGDSQEVLN